MNKRDKGIIVTGSETAFTEYDLSPRYAVAKGALHTLTFASRARLALLGIRINCNLRLLLFKYLFTYSLSPLGTVGVAPSWTRTPLTEEMVTVGILDDSDFIPMQTVVDAYMRLVNNSSLSGAVTRIPTPAHKPFDVVAEPQVKSSLVSVDCTIFFKLCLCLLYLHCEYRIIGDL